MVKSKEPPVFLLEHENDGTPTSVHFSAEHEGAESVCSSERRNNEANFREDSISAGLTGRRLHPHNVAPPEEEPTKRHGSDGGVNLLHLHHSGLFRIHHNIF